MWNTLDTGLVRQRRPLWLIVRKRRPATAARHTSAPSFAGYAVTAPRNVGWKSLRASATWRPSGAGRGNGA